MKVSIEVNTEFIASEINGALDREEVTAEYIESWITQNTSMLPQFMQDAIAESLLEIYENE